MLCLAAAATLVAAAAEPASAPAGDNSEPQATAVSAPQAGAQGRIVVTGHIRGLAWGRPNTLTVSECDPTAVTACVAAEAGADGAFTVSVPLAYPHTLSICYDRATVGAFASPGDTLRVEIDGAAVPVGFTFADETNQRAAEAWGALEPAVDSLAATLITAPGDARGYLAAVRSALNVTDVITRRYLASHGITGTTAALLRQTSLNTVAAAADASYAMSAKARRTMLRGLLGMLDGDSCTMAVAILAPMLRHVVAEAPEAVKKLPQSRLRDVLFALMHDAGQPLAPAQQFADAAFRRRVAEGRRISLADARGSGAMTVYEGGRGTPMKGNPLEYVAQNFAGRTVYLEIAATWCRPCLDELPRAAAVVDAAGNSGPVFVTLWVQSPASAARNVITRNPAGIHIVTADDNLDNYLTATLGLREFPSHYLIRPDGTIVAEGVPAITSPQLADFIVREEAEAAAWR